MTKEEKTAIEGLVEEIKTLHKDMLILNKRVNYILTQVQLGNAIMINDRTGEGCSEEDVNGYLNLEEEYEKNLKKRATEKIKEKSKNNKEAE